ncbi:M16 family metallopeptidase [Janthinobacterium fluminis]|uniref:Insulinase family protein n=1 Tax=Janthinobacterium fluminis TaxID=2987524 RepID=A0ABT5JTZ1_9BURK|nr:M16 family metallopeptidase [Janthinobacterium fluminis]MDC8756168.1 insulinase family protein [Janthinobacterium fluminis]
MTLSSLRILSGAALLALALLARAEIRLDDPVPLGPQVKVGKLANGLTYYIQRNGKPANKLELRLVVKAGSMLEDEDQQGLAHFTEHMAFNGSRHFKRSELISYLQSIGVKFGADLNAYTSFDETVYILPIPTDKRENIEQGFLVLEDWAHGLSFDAAAIDSERGIVLEELRLGKGAEDRMNKVLMPKLFNGSRYAQRLPIGKEATLKHFKYAAIKRFYRDWYRPDLMAVVVVGDIEPAEAEKLIAKHFAKLKNPVPARPRAYAKVPTRTQTEGLVITDKEASNSLVFIRYPVRESKTDATFGGYRDKLVQGLYGDMLSARMQELSQQENPPFIQGGSSMGKLVRGYESFNAYALLGKGGVAPAVDALLQEDGRVRRFGFSAIELERSKKDMLRNFERAYLERDKSDSAGYVAEYVRNFLEQEAIPGIENEYNYVREMLPGITLAEVNQAFAKAMPLHEKKLVVYMGADGGAAPSSAALLAAVDAAERQVLKPKEEKLLGSTLLETPPQPGGIVAETHNAALGLTELTLSNGVKVVLKPTDFKNDQVLLGSTRFGGQSLFGDADTYNARYASAIIGQMGLKTYTPTDLQKILAGKTVNVGAFLGNLSEGLGGSSSVADLETMLQLVYLRYTDARKDDGLYRSFVGKQQDLAKHTMSRPESVFVDTVQTTLYNNHPRLARAARPEDFDKVSLERVLEIYKERFSSARGSTFFLVGSFEVEKVKPLIATYLASLPAAEVASAYKDLGLRPVSGVVKKTVRKGTEAKSSISLTFSGDAAYSEAAQLRLQALVEVMNIKLVEVLREKMGLIYGGGMQGALNKLPYGNYSISAGLPTGPEHVDKVIAATFAAIRQMQENGPLAEDLAKVQENWIKNHQKALRENGYWLGRLQTALVQGSDPADILRYEDEVRALTPADVQAAARRYFNLDNYVQVVLYPER